MPDSSDPQGIPERLGPYRIDGLWHADEVGIVLDGRGPQGRAEIVLLAAAPATDAAARARFAAAVTQLRRDGVALHAGQDQSVPWVAIPEGSGPTGAQPLLAPVWPEVVEDDVRGPTYVPHWRGMPSSYPLRPLPLGRAKVPWWWWLVGFLLALLIAVLLALLLRSCMPPSSDSSPTGTGSGSGSASQSESPSESGSGSPSGSGSESPSGSGEPTTPDPSATGPGDPQETGGTGTFPGNPTESW